MCSMRWADIFQINVIISLNSNLFLLYQIWSCYICSIYLHRSKTAINAQVHTHKSQQYAQTMFGATNYKIHTPNYMCAHVCWASWMEAIKFNDDIGKLADRIMYREHIACPKLTTYGVIGFICTHITHSQ